MATGLLSACALPGRGDLAAAEFTLVAAEVTLVAAEVTLVTAEVTLVAAEVTLTTTGRRSVLRLRADDGGRERHFCPISYNKVKKWANCKDNFDNYVTPDMDFEGYEDQIVEADARDYAQAYRDMIS